MTSGAYRASPIVITTNDNHEISCINLETTSSNCKMSCIPWRLETIWHHHQGSGNYHAPRQRKLSCIITRAAETIMHHGNGSYRASPPGQRKLSCTTATETIVHHHQSKLKLSCACANWKLPSITTSRNCRTSWVILHHYK